MTSIRNRPCPCGSGKKAKRCCLSRPDGAPVVGSRRRWPAVVTGLVLVGALAWAALEFTRDGPWITILVTGALASLVVGVIARANRRGAHINRHLSAERQMLVSASAMDSDR